MNTYEAGKGAVQIDQIRLLFYPGVWTKKEKKRGKKGRVWKRKKNGGGISSMIVSSLADVCVEI